MRSVSISGLVAALLHIIIANDLSRVCLQEMLYFKYFFKFTIG